MPLSSLSAPGPAGPAQHPLAGLVGSIGEPGFAQVALDSLNRMQVQAASWSVYRLWRHRPPEKYLSASAGVADITEACFAIYRQGLYRADRSFDTVAPGQSAVLRMHADDAPSSLHRDAIYRRHGMVERLSVVQHEPDGAVLAVNLYHHQHQGRFTEAEQAGFAGWAGLLLAAVQRHLALALPGAVVGAGAGTVPVVGDAGSTGASVPPDGARGQPAGPGGLRQALRGRCPSLTDRELDVCERLLRGWTYDGIAADLGLGLATVKTYRARAFGRLGLHFKSELFAAFLPAR